MAEIRFNYGDKFTQTSDSNTGIGSTIPAAKLDVAGGTSAGSLRVSGIATLSSYQGFVKTKLTSTDDINVDAGQSGSISGEVVVGTGQTISVSTGATTGQGGIQSLKVSQTFMPPVGGTADRPTDVKPGMVYYNKDFNTIEFWDGNFWKQVDNTTRTGRGVFGGGWDSPNSPATNASMMHSVQITTLGNSEFFGNLTQGRRNPGGRVSDGKRGLILGGFLDPAGRDTIDYCTIASAGDFIDFGNLTAAKYAIASGGVSSSTRGVVAGGVNTSPAYINVIEYVQIQTIGNAIDFGDLITTMSNSSGVNSPTRGLFCGGQFPNSTPKNGTTIQSITIASTGNSIEIGDLQAGRYYGAGVCNNVRGVVGGGSIQYPGSSPGYNTNSIEFVTIASGGNAVFFGDLTSARSRIASAETHIRGLFIGSVPDGPTTSAHTNVIDFINISSAGNAQDFGDTTNHENQQLAGFSDSHGGLGGF